VEKGEETNFDASLYIPCLLTGEERKGRGRREKRRRKGGGHGNSSLYFLNAEEEKRGGKNQKTAPYSAVLPLPFFSSQRGEGKEQSKECSSREKKEFLGDHLYPR